MTTFVPEMHVDSSSFWLDASEVSLLSSGVSASVVALRLRSLAHVASVVISQCFAPFLPKATIAFAAL